MDDAFVKGDAATVLGAMHAEVEWKEAENSPYADQQLLAPAGNGRWITRMRMGLG